MDKDLIVGVVDNYDWDKIKYWANSIKASGFTGHKAIIAYNMNKATIDRLTQDDFMIVGMSPLDNEKGFVYDTSRGSIMTDRFMHIYQMLDQFHNQAGIGRVILTDVRDVVFQDNPSTRLDEILSKGHEIVLGSENLRYKDEPWGANNMRQSFSDFFYEKMADEEIFCAGVIAGTLDTIKDFCLNLWMIARAAPQHVPGGGGPDQAAMNIMISMEHLTYMIKRTSPEDAWVVHAGTSFPAIQAGSGGIGEAFRQNPNMPLPFIKDIEYSTVGDFVRANGEKIAIVHQWDRVPAWKELIEGKYGTN
jgi:hypothetical protein